MLAKLALEDGSVFTGTAFGGAGTRTGEVVFNTSHSGYQEIFTDPSYCGQIVVMTFPQIGNYGVNPADFESRRPHLAGMVIRDLAPRPSNYRATAALQDFLAEFNLIGLCGVDTRALTRRIRIHGALRGALSTETLGDLELVRLARESASMSGSNLVTRVTSAGVQHWSEPLWTPPESECTPGVDACGASAVQAPRQHGRADSDAHIVAIDCGIKHNMLRHLVACGCRVTVVPAGTPAATLRELTPDGLLVGNGPGDPAAVTDTIAMLRDLLGQLPIFGICLGHQMLALALGAQTYKLRFGHHGGNLPVLNIPANRVEITSQNHGFAVELESLRRIGGEPTHLNLNDDSLEGFVHADQQVMAVQFHPEASPGPHDAEYVFSRFVSFVRERRPISTAVFAADPLPV